MNLKPSIKLILTAYIIALISLPSNADIGIDKENDIDAAIQTYLNATNSTAAMFELRESLSNGTYVTRYRKSYGTLTNQSGSKDTPLNVLMRQASVTKYIIRVATQKLISETDMTEDSFVFCDGGTPSARPNCIIPYTDAFNDAWYHDIKVGHLMDHRSKISVNTREDFAFDYIDEVRTPTIQDIINLMRETNLTGKPPESHPNKNANGWWNTHNDPDYEYSGVGYDLLGYVIEVKSGQKIFDYIKEMAVNDVGVCVGDIAPGTPLLSSVIHGREPEYYSVSGTAPAASNMFERPDGSLPLNNLATYPDGTGLYGALLGGGGLLMTTRAMLLFAEKYNIRNGKDSVPQVRITTGGGGPGTYSRLVQRTGESGIDNSFDYALTVNGNGTDAEQDGLKDEIIKIVRGDSSDPNENPIALTGNNGTDIAAAIEFSTQFDTPCEVVSEIHRPDLTVDVSETQLFPLSNAQSITLFNVPNGSVIDLSVLELDVNGNQSEIFCESTTLGGSQQETCPLNPGKLYEVEVTGGNIAGRYMLEAQFEDNPIYTSTIEAENYFNTDLVSPLQIGSDQSVTYVSWPQSGGPMGKGDSATGQVHYAVRATSSLMSLSGTVNFETSSTDSFHYKLEGHDTSWSSKLGPLTSGFEEVFFKEWAGLTPGKMYTLKILRREGLTEIDKLTLTGGEFASATIPGSTIWSEDFSLIDGAMSDDSISAWTSNRAGSGTFEVDNNKFKMEGSGGEGVWSSEIINISGMTIKLSIDVDDGDDSKENADYIEAFYKLDEGTEQSFGRREGNIANPLTFSKSGLKGDSIEIIVRSNVGWSGESYYFDNVSVETE